MDILVKNNIIKKNKIIVDIGSKFTKVLEVNYASKKITVKDAHKFDSSAMYQDGTIDFSEIAKAVERSIKEKKRCEVSVSLPEDLVEAKIVSIKNKKQAEIPKLIEKEYGSFSRVSPLTHVLDYAYLGQNEENGDTLHYCMIAAVHKNTVSQLIAEFEKRKLKITTVTFPFYDMICLSELYHDDYENLSRLMIDFGASGTRVVAFSEGIPVYVRNIDIGFNTYADRLFIMQESVGKPDIAKTLINVGEVGLITNEQANKYFAQLDNKIYFDGVSDIGNRLVGEIRRIIELCETNGIAISKIIYGGYVINGFEKRLKQLGVEIEKFDLDMCGEKDGKDFLLWIDEVQVGSQYYDALGLSVNTML